MESCVKVVGVKVNRGRGDVVSYIWGVGGGLGEKIVD